MSLRRLRGGPAWVALLVWMTACSEPAAPAVAAAVPQDFDDPFAEEGEAGPVPGDRLEAVKVEAAAGEGAVGGSAGVVVGPAEGEAAGQAEAGARGDAVAGAVEETSRPAVEASKPVARKTAGAKGGAPAPVPADSPAPAPVAAPVAAPVEEPAPVSVPVAVERPAPVVAPEKRFVGTYRYAGGEAQKQSLAAAIEAAASGLNVLIRGIGRKRLKESNPVREQIVIAVEGDNVSMTFGPGRTLTGRLGGPAVPWTSDSGKPVRVASSVVKGRLVQVFTAEDGGRRSVYTLDETGDRLTLSVTITSERLPSPLKYALTYKRG